MMMGIALVRASLPREMAAPPMMGATAHWTPLRADQTQVVIFNGVVDGRHDGKGDDGGDAQADGRADAAQHPGHLIAEEQSDVRHHDAGQALAHGDELQQIALGHPAALVHELPLHLGNDAPSAAKGERADFDKVKKHQQGHSCAGGALLCGFGFCCLHESS